MRTSLRINVLTLLTVLWLLPACTFKAPDVIDRHTLMEEEAAGEWPNFERELLDKSTQMGPTAFRKVEPTSKEKRLYNVLNGEPVSDHKSDKQAPKEDAK